MEQNRKKPGPQISTIRQNLIELRLRAEALPMELQPFGLLMVTSLAELHGYVSCLKMMLEHDSTLQSLALSQSSFGVD